MTPIVTICDEKYWPGLKALHNSFLRNVPSERFEFCVITGGDESFADKVRSELGVRVIHEPEFPSKRFPVSSVYPTPFPMSYWRLLVPDLFPAERSIYIDTDSLILQDLQPLVDRDMKGHPVAATRSNSAKKIEIKPEPPGFGPMSSLYVFDKAEWDRKKVLERCVEAMQREDVTFVTLSQALLQFVLNDDWLELPWHYQPHAGHKTFFEGPREEMYTLHFMGTNPWDEFSDPIFRTDLKDQTRALWRTYA